MLEEGLTGARSPGLWSNWSDRIGREEPHVEARGEGELAKPRSHADEVSRILETAAEAAGASGLVLTLHFDDPAKLPVIIRSAGETRLDASAEAQIAGLAERVDVRVQGETINPGNWFGCALGRRAWQILRIPVRSNRGRSRVVMNFLYGNPAAPDRALVTEKVGQFYPMLEAYFLLWQRHREQACGWKGMRGALDLVDLGILLVDRTANIVFANKAASALLDAGDYIRPAGQSFAASALRDAVKLQVALSHAITLNEGQANVGAQRRRAPLLALHSAHNDRPLMLSVFPCEEPAAQDDDVAAVAYALDPAVHCAELLHPVCKLYGLSPVETRLVCLITGGASLQAAAQAMHIKEQTARGYLKQIFLKTDTNRQADLVRVMLCSLMRTQRGIEPEVF